MELSDLLDSDVIEYCISQTADTTSETDRDRSLDELMLAAYDSLCEPSTTMQAEEQEREDVESEIAETAEVTTNALPTTLRSTPTPTPNQPHPSPPPAAASASRFAIPVTDAEVLERRESAIPPKTAQDTTYQSVAAME